ncbi:MAG: hypothetical protein ACJ71U_08080 [Terriglobales bacterium]
MTDETVQTLIAGLERLLKQGGIQTLDDAGATVQRIADILNDVIKPLCNRERLLEELSKIDASAEDEVLIRGMAENFPAIAIALFGEALPLMRKEFPIVNAGRPKSLTSERAKAVCQYIGHLHAQGLDIKTAKQRTAQKFDVSASTIDRTWAERKKGHKLSAKEIVDKLRAKQAENTKALSASREGKSSSK